MKSSYLTFVSEILPIRRQNPLARSLHFVQRTRLRQTLLVVIITDFGLRFVSSVALDAQCSLFILRLCVSAHLWCFRKERDVLSLFSKCPGHTISLFMRLCLIAFRWNLSRLCGVSG